MRVHGRYKIERRTGLEQRNYERYKPELREDFHRMCVAIAGKVNL